MSDGRMIFFRLLQIAVVALYLYKLSKTKGQSEYFNIGLKLLAGSVVAINIRPLINDAAPVFKKAIDIYNAQNMPAPKLKNNVIDGEFRPVT